MPISVVKMDATAVGVTVTDEFLIVTLADGGNCRRRLHDFRACWEQHRRSGKNGG